MAFAHKFNLRFGKRCTGKKEGGRKGEVARKGLIFGGCLRNSTGSLSAD